MAISVPSVQPTHQTSPRKIECSWDDALSGNFPPTPAPAPDAFTHALTTAAATMVADPQIPTGSDRFGLACDLVRKGVVRIEDDGSATVQSGSATYQLTPDCTCQDSQKRSRWCKHYLAVELLTRAVREMSLPQQKETAMNGASEHPAKDQAPVEPAPFAEAPYSATFRALKQGFDVMVTIRKGNNTEFLAALDRMPQWMADHGFEPLQKRGKAADNASGEQPTCDEHGPHKMNPSKYGGWVCSVKTGPESYCNTPWPKKEKRT